MLNFMVGSLFAGIIIIISMTIFHVGEEYSKIVVSNGFVSIVAKRYDGVQQKYIDVVRATIPKERFRFRGSSQSLSRFCGEPPPVQDL